MAPGSFLNSSLLILRNMHQHSGCELYTFGPSNQDNSKCFCSQDSSSSQDGLKTYIGSLDSTSPLNSCSYEHLRIVSNCQLHHFSPARLQLRLWDLMQMSWCHLYTSDSGFKSALGDRNMQLLTIDSYSSTLGLLRLAFTSSCKSRMFGEQADGGSSQRV